MEQELDSTFYWQSLLTQLGKSSLEATLSICNVHDQKELAHEYEKQILIPFLEKNKTKYQCYYKAFVDQDAESQYQIGIAHQNIEWITKAARQNHVLAQNALGEYYDEQ